MARIRITAAGMTFMAETHPDAPKTVAAFMKLLPYKQKVIHVRWSGERRVDSVGRLENGRGFREPHQPPVRRRHALLPGGYSETEFILAYGSCCFASKMGQLAANHFLTIVEGREQLREGQEGAVGRRAGNPVRSCLKQRR